MEISDYLLKLRIIMNGLRYYCLQQFDSDAIFYVVERPDNEEMTVPTVQRQLDVYEALSKEFQGKPRRVIVTIIPGNTLFSYPYRELELRIDDNDELHITGPPENVIELSNHMSRVVIPIVQNSEGNVVMG